MRYVDSVCAIENQYQYQISLEGGGELCCAMKNQYPIRLEGGRRAASRMIVRAL